MSTQRRDPASLSFGRRLDQAEQNAALARKEVETLKNALPAANQMQEAADVLRQQRRAAKQMMARPDATVADLSTINADALTPALQEQLRLSKQDAYFREMTIEVKPFQFQDQAAAIRFENMKQAAGSQMFQQNTQHWNQKQTPYEKWLARQNSPEGKMWNAKQAQVEADQASMQAKARWQAAHKTQPKGRHIGNVKSLEEE